MTTPQPSRPDPGLPERVDAWVPITDEMLRDGTGGAGPAPRRREPFIDVFLEVGLIAMMVALIGIVVAIPFAFAIQDDDWGGVIALGGFVSFFGIVALIALFVQRRRS